MFFRIEKVFLIDIGLFRMLPISVYFLGGQKGLLIIWQLTSLNELETFCRGLWKLVYSGIEFSSETLNFEWKSVLILRFSQNKNT